MAPPFDDGNTGDEKPDEPVDPNPDAIVKFGHRKFTAKERKSAVPELINDMIGAADAIFRRAQKGPISREEAYLAKAIINNPILTHPDATGMLIHRLGLSGAQSLKGKKTSLLPPDPTKEMPPVKLVSSQ